MNEPLLGTQRPHPLSPKFFRVMCHGGNRALGRCDSSNDLRIATPEFARVMHVVNFALGGALGNEGRRAPLAPISNGVANVNAEARRRSQNFTITRGVSLPSGCFGAGNPNRYPHN